VSTEGIYQLINTVASGCADTALLTVSVVTNPAVVTNNPAGVCEPQTADLTSIAVTAGSSPGLSFTYWTNVTATIAFTNPSFADGGTYYIKGTDQFGCFDIKPVTVISYPLPLVNAGNDALVCDNGTAVLSATISGNIVPVTYQWEPVATGGITDPSAPSTLVKPATTQQYIVTVNDNSYGCNFIVSDTVVVTVRPPVPAFAGNDTIAIFGQPHQLRATGGTSYTWSPASLLNDPSVANPVAMLTDDSTMLTVIVKDAAGCIGHDTIWIRAFSNITYYVPSAFSPNNDGRNDIFRPIPIGIVATEMFSIYNRYGEQVFYTNQINKGWDGTHKGKAQLTGNYIWVLRGKGANGRIIEMKGNVVLIR
jgi:gliding motility-associated-like protein